MDQLAGWGVAEVFGKLPKIHSIATNGFQLCDGSDSLSFGVERLMHRKH